MVSNGADGFTLGMTEDFSLIVFDMTLMRQLTGRDRVARTLKAKKQGLS